MTTVTLKFDMEKQSDKSIAPPPRFFSGDDSRTMWCGINKAKTVEELQAAVYSLVLQIQRFEESFYAETAVGDDANLTLSPVDKTTATMIHTILGAYAPDDKVALGVFKDMTSNNIDNDDGDVDTGISGEEERKSEAEDDKRTFYEEDVWTFYENYDLEQCPFCGSSAELINRYDSRKEITEHGIGCSNEECFMDAGAETFFATIDEAVAAWNTRADNPPILSNNAKHGEATQGGGDELYLCDAKDIRLATAVGETIDLVSLGKISAAEGIAALSLIEMGIVQTVKRALGIVRGEEDDFGKVTSCCHTPIIIKKYKLQSA